MQQKTATRVSREPVELRVVGVGELENGHGFYLVPSESDPTRFYVVEQLPTRLECQCKDAFYRRRACKHIRAVEAHKQKIELAAAEARDSEQEADRDTRWSITHAGRAALSAATPAEASSASRGTHGTPERWGSRSQRAFSLLA